MLKNLKIVAASPWVRDTDVCVCIHVCKRVGFSILLYFLNFETIFLVQIIKLYQRENVQWDNFPRL